LIGGGVTLRAGTSTFGFIIGASTFGCGGMTSGYYFSSISYGGGINCFGWD